MNKKAKNELMVVMGLGAMTSLLFRRKKLALGLGLGIAAVALSKQRKADSFKDQVVIITGGSRGLGLALAKRLVREGAFVNILARDQVELERAEQILKQQNLAARVQIIKCDITKASELTSAIAQVAATAGRVDMLINNAGAILVGPFEAMTQDDFEAQMKLHLYANIQATREVLPLFRKKGGGRIVNICSMGGKVAVPHMLPYDTSKFALAGFSQGITAEFSRENISVTTVYPALMRTGSPIQAVFKGDAAKEFTWFANSDVLPGFSMAADEAAAKIIEAARERQAELMPSFPGRARNLMGVLFPDLMLAAMGFLSRLMPRGISGAYHTGAELRKDSSYLLKSLEITSLKAEKDLNQTEKTDAAFNLNLNIH